jgi:hypothetical protein
MCGMPMDRVVDHSAALTAIRYLRIRAVCVTIFTVITILRINHLLKYKPIMIITIKPFEIMNVLWVLTSSLQS